MNNKKIYFISCLIATLLAIIVWGCMPKKYAAQVKISDEYKETDLAVGLNPITAHVKEMMGSENTGINDIEVYCKILKSSQFARVIANKYVPNLKTTYGSYLHVTDTLGEIKDNIEYNLSTKEQTLTIQFKDNNALIASQMLDSIVLELQHIVTTNRQNIAKIKYQNAKEERNKLYKEYKEKEKQLAIFADTHMDMSLEIYRQKYNTINGECQEIYKKYQESITKCTREEMLYKRSYCSFAIIKNNSVPLEKDTNILSYLLSFNAIFLLMTFIVRRILLLKRKHIKINFIMEDVFSPWALTIGIWAINLTLYYLQSDTLYPIQNQFWYCLIAWLPLFTIFSYTAYVLSNTTPKCQEELCRTKINKNIFNILWGAAILLSPLYLYKVMKIVLQFSTTDLLYNIRILAVSGTAGSLVLNSVQAINAALFISAIWLFPKISKLKLISIIIAYLIVEFAMMEKSGILIMILSTLFVLHQRSIIKIRTIAITLACTVFLFFLINSSKEMESGDKMTFVDFFGMYVTSPAVAFGYLQRDLSNFFGINTFSQVYMYLNSFGFHLPYINRIQEFVFVPVPTNVYTIFQPFYEDFGIMGVGIFGILYGFLFGWIYGKYRSGNTYCKLLYTYSVEILIIQFYNENLLQNLFLSVGFIVWTFIMSQRTFVLNNTTKK